MAYTLDRDGPTFLCQTKNDSQPGDMFFKMTLIGEGVMQYIIRAENELGLAPDYEVLTVNIPDTPNRKIHLSGSTENGLIPYLEHKSKK